MLTKSTWTARRGASMLVIAAALLSVGGCASPDTSGARTATMSASSTAAESLEGLRKLSAEQAAENESRRKAFDSAVDGLQKAADRHATGVKLSEAEANAKIDEMIQLAANKVRGELPQLIASDDAPAPAKAAANKKEKGGAGKKADKKPEKK